MLGLWASPGYQSAGSGWCLMTDSPTVVDEPVVLSPSYDIQKFNSSNTPRFLHFKNFVLRSKFEICFSVPNEYCICYSNNEKHWAKLLSFEYPHFSIWCRVTGNVFATFNKYFVDAGNSIKLKQFDSRVWEFETPRLMNITVPMGTWPSWWRGEVQPSRAHKSH